MNKYHNGKIYKIVDVGYNKCYVGSTTEKLSMRMVRHRSDYKRYKNGKIYKITSFDLFDKYGIENCKIELVENVKCETKEELLKKEGEYIRQIDCMNKLLVGRTKKEWYEDNKAEVLNQHKKYRDEHKMEKQETDRLYREKNYEQIKEKQNEVIQCLCGATYTRRNKARHEKTKRHLEHSNSISYIKEKYNLY